MKESYLTNNEINRLIERIKSGDNAAWEQLCDNFEKYIHSFAWKKIKSLNLTGERAKTLEEDLYTAGWTGFIDAVRHFNPKKAKLSTYATKYIEGEISKEWDRLLNPLGLTERPKAVPTERKEQGISIVSLEEHPKAAELFHDKKDSICLDTAPDKGKYSAERRTLQILEILRLMTDENHSVSKDTLMQWLGLYRIGKYKNGAPVESASTITSTLEDMLAELNPMEYSKERDADYRIKYEGYKQDRLKDKLAVRNNDTGENVKTGGKNGKKAADITNFSYVHTFDNEQLDKLIQIIAFSEMLSLDEKMQLLSRLTETASVYYSSPFFDGEKLKFNPKAVHGRFDTRRPEELNRFSKNLALLQEAVNNMAQVRFRFNRYTAEHEKVLTSGYIHTLSPYHLVVYHDNYYCIGLKKDDKRIWHYRVDLMSDIEIIKDEESMIVPIEVSAFEGLPICNAAWNPEKYMSEHLYMAYDEPQDIHIKIKNTDYTIIHDWFGEQFEKTNQPCEDGYDIVKVCTSPSMIVPWAMQYAGKVEIMDEWVREKIREKMERMRVKYE